MSACLKAYPKTIDVKAAINLFVKKFESQNDIRMGNYQLEDNVTNGQNNHCSVISRLRIDYIKDGERFSKSVLLKIPSLSPNYDHLKATNIYDKEVYVYKSVFPELYCLWRHENYFTPKIYNINQYSGIIVMEDLTTNGFVTKNKISQLDYEHTLATIKVLAQFHAVSFKFMQNTGVNELPELMRKGAEMGTSFREYMDCIYDNFVDIVSSSVSESTISKLRDYKTYFWHNAKQIMSPNPEGPNVLIHGDLWTGNVLFKYDESGSSISVVKMVDWQICRVGSPAIDLINFFISSVQFDVFDKELSILLDSYLANFNGTLESLDCDFVLTRKALDTEMDKYKYVFMNVASTKLQLIFKTNGVFEEDEREVDKNLKFYGPLILKWLAYFEANNVF